MIGTVTIGAGEIELCADFADLNRRAGEHFVEISQAAMAERGRFAVALAGGSTPRGLYTALARDQFRNRIAWPNVHLFWGDERCVPPTDKDSNYRMVCEALISKVPLPSQNIHRMPAETSPPEAAVAYEQELRFFFETSPGELPTFDLVLLGMGEDGHTASLFPHSEVLRERESLVAAQYVPKLGSYRLTLTFAVLNQSRNVMFLISGENKAAALRDVLQGPPQPESLPAQQVKPISGRLLWLIERAVAAKLNIE